MMNYLFLTVFSFGEKKIQNGSCLLPLKGFRLKKVKYIFSPPPNVLPQLTGFHLLGLFLTLSL